MSAGKYDFNIEQGSTFRKTITWKDSVGNPIVLTGYTGRMQLRDKSGGQIYIELNDTNGGITFNPNYGEILLYIAATDTALLTLPRLQYDLELTAPNGDVKRLLQGRVKVSEEITE